MLLWLCTDVCINLPLQNIARERDERKCCFKWFSWWVLLLSFYLSTSQVKMKEQLEYSDNWHWNSGSGNSALPYCHGYVWLTSTKTQFSKWEKIVGGRVWLRTAVSSKSRSALRIGAMIYLSEKKLSLGALLGIRSEERLVRWLRLADQTTVLVFNLFTQKRATKELILPCIQVLKTYSQKFSKFADLSRPLMNQ